MFEGIGLIGAYTAQQELKLEAKFKVGHMYHRNSTLLERIVMLLWTIQPERVWRLLKQEKVFRCNPEESVYLNGDGDFSAAYSWLVAQMEERIGKRPEGVTYPVWAWHTFNWKHRKPDLRDYYFSACYGVHTCIEVDIPEENVLLSDEEDWHFVLNDWFYSVAKSEEEYDRLQSKYESLPEEEKGKVREKSWERIFEVEPIDTDWHRQGCYVQAVFWELRLSQVRRVTWFGRYRKNGKRW